MIEKVFAGLTESGPAGLRYVSMRLEDEEAGTVFVHTAEISTEDGSNPPAALAEFGELQTGLPDRTVEAPLTRQATVVGACGF